MDRTLIAWNLPNWITIVLMALAGYMLLALISQGFQKYVGGSKQSANASVAVPS